jgi:hypothetical protein
MQTRIIEAIWQHFNCQEASVLLIDKTKVEVTLRPSVCRPVSLRVRPPSGTREQFFFLFDIFFRQLWVCCFVVLSLTRRRVCNLLLLPVVASAVQLGSALSDERPGLSFVSLLLVSVHRQSVRT